MVRRADWYFDVISPYAYLQFHQLNRLPDDVEVHYRPVLFAALLNNWGQLGPAEIPPKKIHTGIVTAWRARQRGLPFKAPPRHPFNPLKILRLILVAGASRDAVNTAFNHIWTKGQDGERPESLSDLAADLGIDDLENAISASDVKEQLRRNTEEAIARGVYGVPTIAFEDKTFWGEEMFEIFLAWLSDPALLDEGGLLETLSVEPASVRRNSSDGWRIHHVNLPAADVRASAKFYTEILGLQEARWTFPPPEQVGHISADPAQLTLFPCDTASKGANSGLHLIRPEPEFARKNGLDHNPSIGGHVAIQVPDLDAVIVRLKAAGIPFSYAPTFAIPNMRHIYVYDPAMNLIEINEVTAP